MLQPRPGACAASERVNRCVLGRVALALKLITFSAFVDSCLNFPNKTYNHGDRFGATGSKLPTPRLQAEKHLKVQVPPLATAATSATAAASFVGDQHHHHQARDAQQHQSDGGAWVEREGVGQLAARRSPHEDEVNRQILCIFFFLSCCMRTRARIFFSFSRLSKKTIWSVRPCVAGIFVTKKFYAYAHEGERRQDLSRRECWCRLPLNARHVLRAPARLPDVTGKGDHFVFFVRSRSGYNTIRKC